jgi:hypothetical protein
VHTYRRLFFFVREKKDVLLQSRKGVFSLRLCAFASQKISGSRQGANGVSNFFAPVRRGEQVFPSWREKKRS